jgi:hypothetical protein
VFARLHLTAAHGDLFGARTCQRHGGALRVDLLSQRIELALRGADGNARLIEILRRYDALP